MTIRTIRSRKRWPRSRVHRSCGLLPSRQMTSGVPAVRRRDRQCVVVVDMAGETGHIRMAIRQQESGGAVIEQPIGPDRDGMATRTS